MACATVKQVVGWSVGFVALVTFIACLASSFARIEADEVCWVLSPRKGDLQMYNEPGLKFAEPGYEKHCILKSRQHITFGHYTEATGGSGHNVWYKKLLDARTKEGIEVSLEIDIEWEYDESQLDKTILRTGVTNPIERLYVAARSSIRNSAKKFNATDFIEDGRKAISQQMFADLQDYFESDGIYIKVWKVNVLQHYVDSRYKNEFWAIEQLNLIAEREKRRKPIIESLAERLRNSDKLALAADRENRLLLADRAITAAIQDGEKNIIQATTLALTKMQTAVAERNILKIQTNSELDEIKAAQTVLVENAERLRAENMTLIETKRLNIIAEGEGNIAKAIVEAERELALERISSQSRLEGLVVLSTNEALIRLQKNFTGQEAAVDIANAGRARAEDTLAGKRSETTEYKMLKDTLGLSDDSLASMIFYSALKETSGKKTVFADYGAKSPMVLEAANTVPPSTFMVSDP